MSLDLFWFPPNAGHSSDPIRRLKAHVAPDVERCMLSSHPHRQEAWRLAERLFPPPAGNKQLTLRDLAVTSGPSDASTPATVPAGTSQRRVAA